MFDLGAWGEFIIIAITALVIIKPQDFPKVIKQLSRWLVTLRGYKYQVQQYYFEAMHEIEREDILKQENKDGSA